MLADLVCISFGRHLESAALIMGEMYIQKPSGESMTFHIDGTVTVEPKPVSIDWCDKCQRWQPMEFGRYEEADGIKILWFCEACK